MLKKSDKILYEAIREKGLIPEESLASLAKEIESSDENLQQILIRKGLIPEKAVLDILAEKSSVKYIDLKKLTIEASVLHKVPVKIASYYKFVPVELKGNVLTIAVASPLDIKIQDEIRTQLGYDIEVVLSESGNILECLKKYYGLGAETLDRITNQQAFGPSEISYEDVEDIEKLAEDASVIKLVNQIILEGWKKRATDIHIEPARGKVALRYRIDGVLYDANIPPTVRNFLSAIISRIKIMSNLDIVERRLPQDGRAVVKVQDQVLDLRISTIPTPFGESVVVRILPTQMLFSLEKLGLSKADLEIFEELIRKPHGIIFVTGPTGSGKTTTLYASLNRINTKDLKIITIEDPIEYEMSGITQMQVMPDIGLDFARGLRSILRHDPDAIMVGEVRDLETAEIAIRVALTGHIIFSTLHTNDAPSGVTRLIDIGVEPYLVASSVVAFIGQRLIRLLCPDCKYEDTSSTPEWIKNSIVKDLGLNSREVKIFRGKGCANCNFTGFFGRTAIYEILLVDDVMKDLILGKTPSNRIKKIAVSRGMRTLRQDGWRKVIAGVTTPEEVIKVTADTASVEAEGNTGKAQASLNPASPNPTGGQPHEENNKRAYSRLNDEVNLRYKVYKSKDEFKTGLTSEKLGVTKNISAGGLLIASGESLPVGTVLELNIELPDNKEPVECLARIVRVEEAEKAKTYNVAVNFLDLTSAQRVRLNKYIDSELTFG